MIEELQLKCEQLKNHKVEVDTFDREIFELKAMIQALGSGKPVEVKTVAATGPKITDQDIEKWNKSADKTEKQ